MLAPDVLGCDNAVEHFLYKIVDLDVFSNGDLAKATREAVT